LSPLGLGHFKARDVIEGNLHLFAELTQLYPALNGSIESVVLSAGPARDKGTGCEVLEEEHRRLNALARQLMPYAEQTERERAEWLQELERGVRNPARLCAHLGGIWTETCNRDPKSGGCRAAYTIWQDCLAQRLSEDTARQGCGSLPPSSAGAFSSLGALAATLRERLRVAIRSLEDSLALCSGSPRGGGAGPGADSCRNQERYDRCVRDGQRIMIALLIIAGVAAVFGAEAVAAGLLVAATTVIALYRWDCRRYCSSPLIAPDDGR